MKLHTVSESVFNQIDGPRQVISSEPSHAFAVLDLGGNLGCYGLAWRSDGIEPELALSKDGKVFWVGVDQQLAAISLSNGRICLALALFSNLFQILIVDKLTAVLIETEVLLFNPDCSIRCSKALPDIADEMLIVGDNLEIRLLEGYSFILDIQTGNMTRFSEKKTTS